MTTAARDGAAIHVSAMTGVTKIVTAAKESGTATENVRGMIVRAPRTTANAAMGPPTETEVIGTEIGVDHLEVGTEMQYH